MSYKSGFKKYDRANKNMGKLLGSLFSFPFKLVKFAKKNKRKARKR